MIMHKPVLIVEDEIDQRILVRDLLEMFGHVAATASNGQEALDMLSAGRPPCVIFLDITMPVMSGREFLRKLHSGKYPSLTEIPIVVVSAVTDFVQLQEDYPNVVALIKKPMHIDTLRRFAGQFSY